MLIENTVLGVVDERELEYLREVSLANQTVPDDN